MTGVQEPAEVLGATRLDPTGFREQPVRLVDPSGCADRERGPQGDLIIVGRQFVGFLDRRGGRGQVVRDQWGFGTIERLVRPGDA